MAVGLRLGIPLCSPHTCCHWRSEVDALAKHGLSYRQSQWHHHWNMVLNNIVYHSLGSVNVLFCFKLLSLQRADDKRLDRITVAPWTSGKHLVPPAQTCLPLPTYKVWPEQLEQWLLWQRTGRMTSTLDSAYSITPIAIESLKPVAH